MNLLALQSCVCIHYILQLSVTNFSSRFSSHVEANASALLENQEDIFPRYIASDVFGGNHTLVFIRLVMSKQKS